MTYWWGWLRWPNQDDRIKMTEWEDCKRYVFLHWIWPKITTVNCKFNEKKVTFTVLYHFRSSYKVVFGHLYSVMLTILVLITIFTAAIVLVEFLQTKLFKFIANFWVLFSTFFSKLARTISSPFLAMVSLLVITKFLPQSYVISTHSCLLSRGFCSLVLARKSRISDLNLNLDFRPATFFAFGLFNSSILGS